MTNPARRSAGGVARTLAAALTLVLAVAFPATAAEPSKATVTVSATGSQVITWTGTVLPGATGNKGLAADPCANNDQAEDVFTLKVTLANARVYKDAKVTFTISYAWEPNTVDDSTSDIEMEVFGPSGTQIGESTGASASERFTTTNLDEGDYRIVACPASVVSPQDYKGKIEVVPTPKKKQQPATTTTELPAATEGESGGPVKPTPSSGPTATPSRSSTPGVGRVANLLGTQTVVNPSPEETPAAPSAFMGGPANPIEAATGAPPVAVKASNTKSVPLPFALLFSAVGLAGGGFALAVRRRRGMDVPSAAVVPVN
jgi:hypothetical protein